MTPVEFLELCRCRIKMGWTQNCLARNEAGNAVSFNHSDATCWCIMGAMAFEAYPTGLLNDDVSAIPDNSVILKAEKALAKAIGTDKFAEWNDDLRRSQSEVIEALKKAKYIAAYTPELQ